MNTPPTYCYWSVATGPYAEFMARCVASARAAGVFKEFHILTDRSIEGAESYEAFEVEMTDQLYKLIYLKAAISKLNFDYYVWLDADTIFRRSPRNLLACLSRSPIHVPLEVNLTAAITAAKSPHGPVRVDQPQEILYGLSIRQYMELFTSAGVNNPVYWSRSAFWIVRRTAIERVCELALRFRATAKGRCITVDATAGLSYAMQMLCADPCIHEATANTDLWESVDARVGKPGGFHPCGMATGCSAIVHEGSGKQRGGNEKLNEENQHEPIFAN